jgi:glycosyltransferase involved in cell wall biosynthesis
VTDGGFGLGPGPTVTVMIATYNRAALLNECLHHLLRQPFRPGDEVVVVDNGSTDATSAVVRENLRRATVPVIYMHESTPGKTVALQTALTVASGDVIAFIDDDVNVAGAWLEAIRSAMCEQDIVLAGGPVAPRWERPAPKWLQVGEGPYGRLAAPIALLHYGSTVSDLQARTLLGANMAIRRAAIADLGGFATHLGKLRNTLLSGEDADLCERVRRRGWRGVYYPSAVVHHWVPADRMRVRYYLSWFYWSGITNAALDEAAGRRARTAAGVPMWIARRAATALMSGVVAALLGRSQHAIEAAIDVAYAWGYTARSWHLTTAATPAPKAAKRSAA